MNVEIKVKIETEHVELELTQAEARSLYEELKLMFDVKETVYTPFVNPLAPTPWQVTPPYYVGDIPNTGFLPNTGYLPHVTCLSKDQGNNDE